MQGHCPGVSIAVSTKTHLCGVCGSELATAVLASSNVAFLLAILNRIYLGRVFYSFLAGLQGSSTLQGPFCWKAFLVFVCEVGAPPFTVSCVLGVSFSLFFHTQG